MPSFPGTVMEIVQRIRNPDSSAKSVAEILALDPGLTIRVLRIANSAAFSPVKKIENLSQAVALVGLSQLESLVLSVAVKASIPRKPIPGYDFKQFWKASVRRGVLARDLATILCPTRKAEAFTSGFLQDLAIPFLVSQKPKEYGPVLKKWHDGNQDLIKLEQEAFEWDHAEVATWICHKWDLPENIASAIGGHHKTKDSEYDCPPPVSLVANIRETEESLGLETLIEMADSQYGIPSAQTEELVESSFKKSEDLIQLMV
ncbi:MAG: HDOD domain-containing protein [Proteobacteria bacterium]|nr:HDOD domain-containing protein [Pseudomonadota bacterium]